MVLDGLDGLRSGGRGEIDVRKSPRPSRFHCSRRPSSWIPYNASAIYKLAFAYAYSGQPKKQAELLSEWRRIKPDQEGAVPGSGHSVETKYGDMGKYANVVNPFPELEPNADKKAASPVFEAAAALDVKLPDGHRWVKESDFTAAASIAGRVRARFGAAVSAFDADGDGKLDSDRRRVQADAGPKGVHDVLLLNKGEGRFEDASAASKQWSALTGLVLAAARRAISTPTGVLISF